MEKSEKLTAEKEETLISDKFIDYGGPNSKRSLKKWTKEQDKQLIELADKTNGKKWKWIATQISGKTDFQCRSRWERIRPGMKQGRWTKAEDELLMQLYNQHLCKWSLIAKILQNRTGKQVRDRIKNCFESNRNKENFSQEDDDLVFKMYLKHGPRWKKIRDLYFPTRSSDFIKNRFYCKFRRMNSKNERINPISSNEDEKTSEIKNNKIIKISSEQFKTLDEKTNESVIINNIKSPIPSLVSPMEPPNTRDNTLLNFNNQVNNMTSEISQKNYNFNNINYDNLKGKNIILFRINFLKY